MLYLDVEEKRGLLTGLEANHLAEDRFSLVEGPHRAGLHLAIALPQDLVAAAFGLAIDQDDVLRVALGSLFGGPLRHSGIE